MIATFREIVAVDFEFTALPGERPDPVCLVAHELHSGRRFRIWQDEFGPAPPYATGPDVLFVLCISRTWVLPGAQLAVAGTRARPLCRIPGPDQRPTDAGRLGSARRIGLLRARRHGREREEGNSESDR